MRRFIVTKSVLIDGVHVPVKGYWIGPGKKSVVTQNARIRKDILNSMRRVEQGRYGWHPLGARFLTLLDQEIV